MCEIKAFILKDQKEEKIMESVQYAVSSGSEVTLEDIFGTSQKLAATFKFFDAENNKIVFESSS